MMRGVRTTLAAGLLLSGLAAQDDDVRAAIATLLRDGPTAAHCDALALLGRSGVRAEPAMPMIAEVVGDAQARVRHAAVAALIALAPHASRAVPILIAHLDSQDDAVRDAARAALDVVAVQRQRGIEELREALRSGEPERQRPVLAAMRAGTGDARTLLPDLIARLAVETGSFGHEARSVARELATGSHTADLVAAIRGAGSGPTRDALLDLVLQVAEADAPDDTGLDALLIELASDTSPLAGSSALRGLAERAVYRPALIADLRSVFAAGDRNRREMVLQAWSSAGAGVDTSIDFLGRQLRDRHLIGTLSGLLLRAGPAAETLVPMLAEILTAGDRYVAPIAARALAGLGTTAAAAFDALVAGAAHPDPQVASHCLDALTWIPGEARTLETTLHRAMLHEDAEVRVHALAAMVVRGHIEAAPALALVDALDDIDVGVRTVATALVPLGGPAVFEIVARGEHPSPHVRTVMATLRVAFDAAGDPTAAAVRNAAMHASTPVRTAALATLERRPALDGSELELVRAALGTREPGLAVRAARVVIATKPAAEHVVPLLAPWLESYASLTRDTVRDAIAALGDTATDALVDLLRHDRHTAAILSLFAARDGVPATVWPWVERACASSDIRARTAARAVLARHGATAPVPPRVIAADELRLLREQLATALRNPRESIETLLALAHDGPAAIRAGALRGMYRLAGDKTFSPRIVAVAAASLSTVELEVVDAAATVLRAARGAALEPLLRLVCEGDALLRARAGLLARECDPRGTLPLPDHVWRRLLETDTSTLRTAALQRATDMDPAALRLLLVALLDDPDQAIRWHAFAHIERIGAPRELLDRLEVLALHGTPFECERAVGLVATIQPEGLDVLFRVVREGAPAARRRALQALAEHGAEARVVFEPALAALHDADARTAEAAARLLVAMELDPHGEPGLRLLEAFRSLVARTDRARTAAILAVAIGAPAAPHWSVFESLSRTSELENRAIAARAMLAVATEASPLEAALVSGPRQVPWALAELPGGADPVRIVLFLLPHIATIDNDLAYPLGKALARSLPDVDVGLETAVVRAVLLRMAGDPSGSAFRLEPAIGAAARTATELVAPLVQDADARHAQVAISALAVRAPSVVGSWVGSGPVECDRRLLAVLASVGGHDEERARILARSVDSDDSQLRSIALHGLAGCGRKGATLLAELFATAARTGGIDGAPFRSIARLGDEAELLAPGFLTALRNGTGDRNQLLGALALCGPRGIAALEVMHAAGEQVVEFIAMGLNASGPRTRIAALRATLAVRPGFEAVGRAVIVSLHHADPEVRTWAAIALCGIARDHQEAQPALRSVLAFPDPILRARAISVFRVVELPLDLALLVEALDDPDAAVRRAAAGAIARLGPDAAPCRIALRERLQDQDPDVRQAVLGALRRIGD